MKDIGDHANTADIKKYKEVPYAGDTYKEDYLKSTDGKQERNTKKIKRSMIKE